MKKIKFMTDKQELFSKKNVISCYSGYKTINGKETEEKCLVVGVEKKLPLSELNEEDIIPDIFNGKKTDVLEVPMMQAGHCADGDGATSPSSSNNYGCLGNAVKDDNTPFRCLPAGSSIGVATENTAGTLGFFAVDEDGQLCAVTNNHVALNTGYYSEYQAPVHIYLKNDYLEDGTPNLRMESVTTNHQGKTEYGSATNFTFNGDPLDGGLFEVGRTYVFHLDGLNMDGEFYLLLDDGSKYTESKIAKYPLSFTATIDPEDSYTVLDDRDKAGAYNYISGDESLIVTYYPDKYNFSKLHYHYKTPDGKSHSNEINYFYYGVPHCHLKSTDGIDPTEEYPLKEPSSENLDKYKPLVTPSNIENWYLDSGTRPIGKVKYSEPLFFEHKLNYGGDHGPNDKGLQASPLNLIDACTISLSKDVCPSNETIGLTTSYQDTDTASIGDFVYKSGRTTGVTPPKDLPLDKKPKVVATDWSGYISFCSSSILNEQQESQELNSWQHIALFEDCYYYKGEGVWFSDSGDSGSGVYKDSDTGKKLIALHFGGSSEVSFDAENNRSVVSNGIGCKIQNVMDILNLTPWNGKRSLPKSLVGDQETIAICGKTFIKSPNQEKYQNGEAAGSSYTIFED